MLNPTVTFEKHLDETEVTPYNAKANPCLRAGCRATQTV